MFANRRKSLHRGGDRFAGVQLHAGNVSFDAKYPIEFLIVATELAAPDPAASAITETGRERARSSRGASAGPSINEGDSVAVLRPRASGAAADIAPGPIENRHGWRWRCFERHISGFRRDVQHEKRESRTSKPPHNHPRPLSKKFFERWRANLNGSLS